MAPCVNAYVRNSGQGSLLLSLISHRLLLNCVTLLMLQWNWDKHFSS